MKVVVIGGNGHIGTYLVPALVHAGHEVVNISRGLRSPYQTGIAWNAVEQLQMDRFALEADGTFGENIQQLNADVVIDIICFKLSSAQHLVRALEGRVQHLLSCGTIWVHGPSVQVPTTEDQPRKPVGDYGTNKALIEEYLIGKARREGLPATVIHPGHIVGPGWAPVNPAGHFNLDVFSKLAQGQTIQLPNFGLEMLHHVHASDVARMFLLAMQNWNQSIGQSFHAVSPAAVTLRGYAEEAATWFGQEASIEYLPWSEWRQTVSEEDADATKGHISRSLSCSIAKAERLLGYKPHYTSFEAVREAVQWLVERGEIQTRA